ncbi:MAG: hypothetical protein ACR2L0_01190 [Gaiellaceae bacterium]
MDGLLDWYLLGVAVGLGVAAGIALVWLARGRVLRPLAAAALLVFVVGGVLIAVLAVAWAAVALAGGAAVAAASVRKLAAQALPAAALGAAVVALVPLAGYLEAVAAPFLGRRLGRRAGSRYAGLRVLAKE